MLAFTLACLLPWSGCSVSLERDQNECDLCRVMIKVLGSSFFQVVRVEFSAGGLMEEHLVCFLRQSLKGYAALGWFGTGHNSISLGCWDYRGAPHTISLSLRKSLSVLSL